MTKSDIKQIKEYIEEERRFYKVEDRFDYNGTPAFWIAARALVYCDTKEKIEEVISLLKEMIADFDEHYKPEI